MTPHACAARRDLVKEQAAPEEMPRKRGRPKTKVTIIGPEKCLECKTGLIELKKDQVVGVTDEGNRAKTCTECGEKKGVYYFDANRNICVLCVNKRKEERSEKMAQNEEVRKNKDLEDFIEVETIGKGLTLAKQKADLQNVSYTGPTLSLDFSLVAGLMEALQKSAAENLRTVELQALFIIKYWLSKPAGGEEGGENK